VSGKGSDRLNDRTRLTPEEMQRRWNETFGPGARGERERIRPPRDASECDKCSCPADRCLVAE